MLGLFEPPPPGMRYQCQRCTACCRWPGDVHVSATEITAIAALLGLSEEEFIQRHTRLNATRTGLSLLEDPETGHCSFLDGNDCRIQKAKPTQCVGFPNTWNFPGWRKICHATTVPDHQPST